MIPVTPVTKERFLWNSSRSRCPFLCGILLVAKCDFEYDYTRARRHARSLLYTHTVKQLTELPRPLWNPIWQKMEYDFTRALAHTHSFSYTHNVKQLNEVPALWHESYYESTWPTHDPEPRHRLRQLKVQIGMTTPVCTAPTSSNPSRNSILHQFDLYIFDRLTYVIN